MEGLRVNSVYGFSSYFRGFYKGPLWKNDSLKCSLFLCSIKFICCCCCQVPLKFVARPQRKVASSVPSGYVMECDVTGQPKPNITWLLNGKQFTGTSRISIKPNRLVFSIIYGGDIGVYQCIADNGREMVQSSAVLITAGMCARTTSCSL